jgi:predicted DNA-binding protein with PD1-like motif
MQSNEKDGVLFVRLFPGEDVPASLMNVCRERGITSGALLCGIGMLRDVELSYYSGGGGYDSHAFPDPMELVSLSGNIARDGEGILIHAHAALAARDGRMVGGHLSKGTVAVTAEVVILRTSVGAERRIEPETGLKGLFLDE